MADDWQSELQNLRDFFAGSTTFWVIGAVVLLVALGTFVRGRR